MNRREFLRDAAMAGAAANVLVGTTSPADAQTSTPHSRIKVTRKSRAA
ncbi:MAG TPA: twin-arginine translocation signal domain-containing protein [Vicinamibacterales bacterium]|nr:twin-arginine translocation signal domain-containing protein [Vicinamibacterales bacterium]